MKEILRSSSSSPSLLHTSNLCVKNLAQKLAQSGINLTVRYWDGYEHDFHSQFSE